MESDERDYGQPPLPPGIVAEQMVGRRLGPFRLIDTLGSGGFCTVFRARHEWLAMPFAVKVLIPSPDLPSAARLERFRNEARLGLRLRHPNIATVCMAGTDELENSEGRYAWMASDLVDGSTVTRLMNRANGPLKPDSAVPIAMQVLRALAYVHEQGYVHGDIKPANIVVTPNGRAQLIDFGLAARVDHVTNRAAGTVGFIAPENWAAQYTIRPTADIYSVGALLWAMLAGRQPRPKLPGPCPLETLPSIDVELQAVMGRLVAEKAAERYASADEAYGGLDTWLRRSRGVAVRVDYEVPELFPDSSGNKEDEWLA